MMESRQEWLQRIREARSTMWLSNHKAEVRPTGLRDKLYVDKVTGRTLNLRVIDDYWSENHGESHMDMTLVHNRWNNGDNLQYEEYLEVKRNIEELFRPLDCRVRFE